MIRKILLAAFIMLWGSGLCFGKWNRDNPSGFFSLYMAKYPPFILSISDPKNLPSDTAFLWYNWTGASVTIDSIWAQSINDSIVFDLVETDTICSAWSRVDSVNVNRAGTLGYHRKETVISGPTIEATHSIYFIGTRDDSVNTLGMTVWFH